MFWCQTSKYQPERVATLSILFNPRKRRIQQTLNVVDPDDDGSVYFINIRLEPTFVVSPTFNDVWLTGDDSQRSRTGDTAVDFAAQV